MKLAMIPVLAFLMIWSGATWYKATRPIPQPIPVHFEECPPTKMVVDFPVYGGTHFRQSTIPCVWA